MAYDGIAYDGIAYDGIAYDGIAYDGIAYDGIALTKTGNVNNDGEHHRRRPTSRKTAIFRHSV